VAGDGGGRHFRRVTGDASVAGVGFVDHFRSRTAAARAKQMEQARNRRAYRRRMRGITTFELGNVDPAVRRRAWARLEDSREKK
jgi:hypothetical protein